MAKPEWWQYVSVEMLGGSQRALVELIGLDGMLCLCNEYGGRSIYVPMRDTSQTRSPIETPDGFIISPAQKKLAGVIGAEATHKLCAEHGGERLYIPNTSWLYSSVKAFLMRRDSAKGLDVKALARKYGMTSRNAERILNG